MTLHNFKRLAFVLIRNCLFGGNIASLRFILSPRKFVTYQQACMDLFGVYSNIGIPSITLSEFLNYKEDIRIRLCNINTLDIMGSSTANMKDRLIFLTIAKVIKPKAVFEIGTFRGESAANFALNTPEDATIYTLDLPPTNSGDLASHNHSPNDTTIMDRQLIKQRYTETYAYESIEEAKKVVQIYGNSFDYDFTPYYNKIDLFLVDGAHNYFAVVKDTDNALRCIKEGGIIMWHDYGRWGINEVSEYLHKLRKSGYNIQRVVGSHVALLRAQNTSTSLSKPSA